MKKIIITITIMVVAIILLIFISCKNVNNESDELNLKEGTNINSKKDNLEIWSNDMEMKNYIKNSIQKLNLLGITTSNDDEIMNNILQMPSDILYDLDRSQILGLILDDIGISEYDIQNNEYRLFCNNLYSFDTEVEDIDMMYTIFLNFITKISNDEWKISDIIEDNSNINYEKGTGVKIIHFKLNGKEYKYEAKVMYDWFDIEIISYINQILEEQNSNQYLYVTSDGWQNCILFYNTEEWKEKYNEVFVELQVEKM